MGGSRRARSRRVFLRRLAPLAVSLAALGVPSGCGIVPGSAPARVYRIGLLSLGPLEGSPYLEAVRQGLRELGYVEGRNLVMVEPHYDNPPREQVLLATELGQLNVDLILVIWGSAISARNTTGTIPIVFTTIPDPLTAGTTRIIDSLARPGRNVTGLTTLSGGLTAKRLQLLREAAPRISRVGVLLDPGAGQGPGQHQTELFELSPAAQALGLSLQLATVLGPGDFERAFAALGGGQVDALLVLGDFLTIQQRDRIVDFARSNRLPTMNDFREFADAGGMLAYGPNVARLCRRAATYVDRIFKGTAPGELPVEQPTEFEFVVNLQAAQAVGLTVPASVLAQASEVIK